MTPTDLLAQYREMHEAGHFKGLSLRPHLNAITRLVLKHDTKTVLDYGCGKAELYTALDLRNKWRVALQLYDPAVPKYAIKPTGMFDGVICTDVIEHIAPNDVSAIIDDVLSYAGKWAFFSICTRPARKMLPDGRNVHLTVRPQPWWESRISEARLKHGKALEVEIAFVN